MLRKDKQVGPVVNPRGLDSASGKGRNCPVKPGFLSILWNVFEDIRITAWTETVAKQRRFCSYFYWFHSDLSIFTGFVPASIHRNMILLEKIIPQERGIHERALAVCRELWLYVCESRLRKYCTGCGQTQCTSPPFEFGSGQPAPTYHIMAVSFVFNGKKFTENCWFPVG
ncbi:hypothetical protein NE237_001090 [Protea cynaroides]|uniref:Uncharacterized protein n=1 Tax=Protea cynaroides TaxID=273540 RepID=A0A9Q0KTG6_9MAGN|nr:hypothetical protein NE237_001090 [Protea cynaroides]